MYKKPKISIIVPVYNVEQYLRRCIDSILNQSFTDFELLLIDDGSKDSSGEICDEYVARDSRIRVFHKENGGVSSARNLGLDNAMGEYITFVDADDYLLCNTITDKIFNEKFDLIQLNRSSGSYLRKIRKNIICNKITSNKVFLVYTYEIWGKVIKREIIGKTRFDKTLSIGEDILFNIMILDKIKNFILFTDSGGYFYNINEYSVMNRTPNVNKDCLMLISLIQKYLLENPCSKVALYTLLTYKIDYRNKDGNYYNSLGFIPVKKYWNLPVPWMLKIKLLLYYVKYIKINNL